MKVCKFPQTDSIQELARFWDTHDLADFEDQLEEVTDPVFQRRAMIQFHLEPSEAQVVRRLARARGVADTDLLREWVLEKLRASAQTP